VRVEVGLASRLIKLVFLRIVSDSSSMRLAISDNMSLSIAEIVQNHRIIVIPQEETLSCQQQHLSKTSDDRVWKLYYSISVVSVPDHVVKPVGIAH
jgi:hypothetical protein